MYVLLPNTGCVIAALRESMTAEQMRQAFGWRQVMLKRLNAIPGIPSSSRWGFLYVYVFSKTGLIFRISRDALARNLRVATIPELPLQMTIFISIQDMTPD